MLLTRFDPQREFNELRRGFRYLNDIFNDFETFDKEKNKDFIPTVNTREAEDAYYVEADLPGIRKEEIAIDVHDKTLTISGERKVEETFKEDEYYRIESRYGKFERSFTLPDDADEDAIEAEAKDGVLEVKIPKSAVVENTPKKIEIK